MLSEAVADGAEDDALTWRRGEAGQARAKPKPKPEPEPEPKPKPKPKPKPNSNRAEHDHAPDSRHEPTQHSQRGTTQAAELAPARPSTYGYTGIACARMDK